MADMETTRELLAGALADAGAGWAIGSFGAIAEFHQTDGEPVAVDDAGDLARATRRGGIRIELDALPAMRLVAYEMLSPKPHRWSQGIALCLDEPASRRQRRAVLTELGPDEGAIRAEDRDGILFDMGLAQPQIDFCVRASDPELLDVLWAACGRSLFEPGNPAMGEILKRHPHRVAVSNLGRAEVYQKIGGAETGGVSPVGPHTHVLPQLLKSGRTHSANTPIPEGLIPCGSLFPASPVMGPLGEDTDFDPARFETFQRLLAAYGPAEYVAAKSALRAAVEQGEAPETFAEPGTRLARTAVRNMLRQLSRLADHRGDAALADRVAAWRRRFDSTPDPAGDDDEDAPGH